MSKRASKTEMELLRWTKKVSDWNLSKIRRNFQFHKGMIQAMDYGRTVNKYKTLSCLIWFWESSPGKMMPIRQYLTP